MRKWISTAFGLLVLIAAVALVHAHSVPGEAAPSASEAACPLHASLKTCPCNQSNQTEQNKAEKITCPLQRLISHVSAHVGQSPACPLQMLRKHLGL